MMTMPTIAYSTLDNAISNYQISCRSSSRRRVNNNNYSLMIYSSVVVMLLCRSIQVPVVALIASPQSKCVISKPTITRIRAATNPTRADSSKAQRSLSFCIEASKCNNDRNSQLFASISVNADSHDNSINNYSPNSRRQQQPQQRQQNRRFNPNKIFRRTRDNHNNNNNGDIMAVPVLDRNPPRKVCLMIEPTPFTHVSGYANRFKEMLHYLHKAGDTVDILTVDSKTPFSKLPKHYEGYPIRHTQGFTFPLYNHISLTVDLPEMKGARIIEQLKPDLIHVTSPGFLLFAALFYARVMKIPLVMSYHTHLPTYGTYFSYIMSFFGRLIVDYLQYLFNDMVVFVNNSFLRTLYL
jgi:Glycosyltransferase Family 4